MQQKKQRYYEVLEQLENLEDADGQFKNFVDNLSETEPEMAWRVLLLMFAITPALRLMEAGLQVGGETYVSQAAEDIEMFLCMMNVADRDELPATPPAAVKALQEELESLRKSIEQTQVAGMSSSKVLLELISELDLLRSTKPGSESIN